jgi:hypothetical protein
MLLAIAGDQIEQDLQPLFERKASIEVAVRSLRLGVAIELADHRFHGKPLDTGSNSKFLAERGDSVHDGLNDSGNLQILHCFAYRGCQCCYGSLPDIARQKL